MDLLCAARGPGPPPKTKDNMAPCGGCLLPARDPYSAGAEAVPGKSSATTMSAGGGGGEDAHESERSLLSFSRSELSRHLSHVDPERTEEFEGLL